MTSPRTQNAKIAVFKQGFGIPRDTDYRVTIQFNDTHSIQGQVTILLALIDCMSSIVTLS